MAAQEDPGLVYDPTVYQTEEWFDSLAYTNEWNLRALFAVLAILGKPQTFMDIGCGNGTLVNAMAALEEPWDPIEWSFGVDLWLPHELDTSARFKAVDLREPYDRGRQSELVSCWEVGEHLPEESADVLCETVARHVAPGGHLVWTAAQPGQGGDHHINEQRAVWWLEKLKATGLAYQMGETGRVQTAWQWATGPCDWLPANVMVFGNVEGAT